MFNAVFAEEICGELRTEYACVVCSALALRASEEQMCMLKATRNANLKDVSEQVRQMLRKAAHMTDP